MASEKCTVVTAFVDLADVGTKQAVEWYLSYAKKFTLLLDLPMIIFIEKKHLEVVKKCRDENGFANKTKYVVIERSGLRLFPLYELASGVYTNLLKNQVKVPNPAYMLTVHSKCEFMIRSIIYNSFDTEYFMWLDFGIFYRGYGSIDADYIMKIASDPKRNPSYAIIDPGYTPSSYREQMTGFRWIAAAGIFTLHRDAGEFDGFLNKWETILKECLQEGMYPSEENIFFHIWKNNLCPVDVYYANYDTLAIKYHGDWPKEDAKKPRESVIKVD
jgi:hypothetical protein